MSYRSMEEFLVSAGIKEPVVIQADKTEASYDTMPQTIRESLTLYEEHLGIFQTGGDLTHPSSRWRSPLSPPMSLSEAPTL